MIHKTFFLCLWVWFSHGVIGDTDEVKSVSVTEGDSVSLNTDVTEIQRNDQILWMFKVNNTYTRIAEIHKQVIDMYDSTLIFGDRLQMDSWTGSLTVRNIRTEHTGLYKLTIIKASGVTYKSFSVAVYAPLPIPVITRDTSNCSSSFERSSSSSSSSVSRCVLLCSAVNVSAVTLSWYKGNSLLSSISVSDLSISLSLPLEVEYQENNIYSCVINNPITNQTQHNINITQLCHTCPEREESSRLISIVVIALLLLLLAVVAGLIYCYRKHKLLGKEDKAHEEEILYADTTFCSYRFKRTEVVAADQTLYSTVKT
ncbi:SLAM family member 9-like isoform X2 [Carassius carassius]|uniref:SLAM family member 9-like isoform X1 n=1 Tax=Carassius carassius TaxID=217509 RepID=UPI0028695752|nr:SLAM family member 9-like isoform X1 [Carassius carassius]XP_059425167.1 SLAM family member 9-like isoform X2 [Carassius carassius]